MSSQDFRDESIDPDEAFEKAKAKAIAFYEKHLKNYPKIVEALKQIEIKLNKEGTLRDSCFKLTYPKDYEILPLLNEEDQSFEKPDDEKYDKLIGAIVHQIDNKESYFSEKISNFEYLIVSGCLEHQKPLDNIGSDSDLVTCLRKDNPQITAEDAKAQIIDAVEHLKELFKLTPLEQAVKNAYLTKEAITQYACINVSDYQNETLCFLVLAHEMGHFVDHIYRVINDKQDPEVIDRNTEAFSVFFALLAQSELAKEEVDIAAISPNLWYLPQMYLELPKINLCLRRALFESKHQDDMDLLVPDLTGHTNSEVLAINKSKELRLYVEQQEKTQAELKAFCGGVASDEARGLYKIISTELDRQYKTSINLQLNEYLAPLSDAKREKLTEDILSIREQNEASSDSSYDDRISEEEKHIVESIKTQFENLKETINPEKRYKAFGEPWLKLQLKELESYEKQQTAFLANLRAFYDEAVTQQKERHKLLDDKNFESFMNGEAFEVALQEIYEYIVQRSYIPYIAEFLNYVPSHVYIPHLVHGLKLAQQYQAGKMPMDKILDELATVATEPTPEEFQNMFESFEKLLK